MVFTSSEPGFIGKLFVGTDRRLRPIVCALLYAALAFWLLSADWVLGPVLERVANALDVRGLSPGTVVFFETINLATALLLTWIFARYEHRRVDSYGLPMREAFAARYWEGFGVGVVNTGAVALGMAVGYHASFDYMQLFVIGTKNGNVAPVAHLLNASFQGPDWVTGGVPGTEASLLMYPSLALLFLYTWWRFGRERIHHPLRVEAAQTPSLRGGRPPQGGCN